MGIRTSTTMDKIGEIMGPLFGEVYAYIQQSGQQPAGMPFALYHSMNGNTVELECGMPVASPTLRARVASSSQASCLPGQWRPWLTPVRTTPSRRRGLHCWSGWTRRASSPRARPGRSTSQTPAPSPTNRSGVPISSSRCVDRPGRRVTCGSHAAGLGAWQAARRRLAPRCLYATTHM